MTKWKCDKCSAKCETFGEWVGIAHGGCPKKGTWIKQ